MDIIYLEKNYVKLTDTKDVYRITSNGLEIPFERDDNDLLIPLGVFQGNEKSVELNLISLKEKRDIKLEVSLPKQEFIKHNGKGILTHAYSSSSSYTDENNYQEMFSLEKVKDYAATGLKIWYEQAIHVTSTDTSIKKELIYLIENIKKCNLKILLSDDLFNDFSKQKESIYNRDLDLRGRKLFIKNQDELDELTEARLKMYFDYPEIIGVSVGDEQTLPQIQCGFKEILQSIHRVLNKLGRNDFFINTNMVPIHAPDSHLKGIDIPHDTKWSTYDVDELDERIETFETFLNEYLRCSQNNYIQYDIYPFTSNDKFWMYEGLGLCMCSIFNHILVAKMCKDKDLEFKIVTQSLMYYGTREISPSDIAWMNNMLLGFGAKHISYFVYQCRKKENTGAEVWQEKSSFLDIAGNKNPLYYYYQGYLAQLNNFEKIISEYDYEWCHLYHSDKENSPSKCYTNAVLTAEKYYGKSGSFADLKDVKVSKDWVLTTVLSNKNDKNVKMYYIQNIHNHFDDNLLQNIEIEFGSDYRFAEVYESGTPRIEKINNRKLNFKLSSGNALFIIPIK